MENVISNKKVNLFQSPPAKTTLNKLYRNNIMMLSYNNNKCTFMTDIYNSKK